MRFRTIPAQAGGIRDVEHERDALANFSWVHTFLPGLLLTVSPFYHGNIANYDGGPNDVPVATTQHRNSQYAGAQIACNAATPHHNASAGVYAFGQHDDEFVGLIAHDAPVFPWPKTASAQANWRQRFWNINTALFPGSI